MYMNDKFKAFFSRLKNGRLILIFGVVGVLLILLSGISASDEKEISADAYFDITAYQQQLEKDLE